MFIIQQQHQQHQQAAVEEERQRVEVKRQMERKAEVKKEVVAKEQASKKEVVKVIKTEQVKKKVSHSLTELHALRLRLEAAEGTLIQHVHVCIGNDGVRDCGLKITELEVNAKKNTHTNMKTQPGVLYTNWFVSSRRCRMTLT